MDISIYIILAIVALVVGVIVVAIRLSAASSASVASVASSRTVKAEPKRAITVEEDYSTFVEVVKEIVEEQPAQEQELDQTIVARFDEWVERKGYLSQGVTIQGVAAEIKTNRTYLSSYFNAKYNTSFREWVTLMRIEESKEVLRRGGGVTISELSSRVGFASVASFSRAFARQEGLSPAAWRAGLSE